MNSVCRRRSVGSKCAPKGSVNSVRSVREKTPQRLAWVLSYREDAFYFSQKNTEEQNTQHSTETWSQPISQNVTANVSWKASVKSVCRRRSVGSKRWWKSSVKSASSVRKILYEKCKQADRGNLTYYSPLHSERGWGWGLCEFCMPEAFCEFETVCQKVLLSLCALWEKNLSTISPHVLPDCRRALTTFQNMPFLHAEHALLAPRRVCSWRMYITSWFLVGYKLD